jgi:hypothetical protein
MILRFSRINNRGVHEATESVSPLCDTAHPNDKFFATGGGVDCNLIAGVVVLSDGYSTCIP